MGCYIRLSANHEGRVPRYREAVTVVAPPLQWLLHIDARFVLSAGKIIKGIVLELRSNPGCIRHAVCARAVEYCFWPRDPWNARCSAGAVVPA